MVASDFTNVQHGQKMKLVEGFVLPASSINSPDVETETSGALNSP